MVACGKLSRRDGRQTRSWEPCSHATYLRWTRALCTEPPYPGRRDSFHRELELARHCYGHRPVRLRVRLAVVALLPRRL